VTSLRRPFVRFVVWACVLVGIIAVAAVAGLHWWVIAVAAIAWAFITAADRGLEGRLAAAGVPAAAPAGAGEAEQPDQVPIASALVTGATAPEHPEVPVEAVEPPVIVVVDVPGVVAEEPEVLVSVSAVVAAPPTVTAEPAEPETEPTVPAPVAKPLVPPSLAEPAAPASASSPAPEPEPAATPPPTAPAPPPAEAAPAAAPPPVPQPEPPVEQPTAAPAVPEPQRRWSIWTLDRLARETGNEELTFLVFSLQDYADIDGLLPLEFDPLVRESFGEFLGSAAA
jgi:hypothetical protein